MCQAAFEARRHSLGKGEDMERNKKMHLVNMTSKCDLVFVARCVFLVELIERINRKNLKNDPLFQKVIHSMVSFSFIFKYFYDFDWLCMYWSHHYWSYPPTARQVWPHGSGRKSPHRWLAVEILWNLGSEQWATRFDDPLGLPKILPIGTNQPRFSNDPLGGIKMLHIHTYSVRFD